MQMVEDKKSNKDIFMPGLDGPLVSFSLFNELQPNIIKPNVLEKEYKNYKTRYEHKKHQSFYIEYANDEWFKEKYDPVVYDSWKKERNNICQILANEFISDIRNDKFSKLKLELDYSSEDLFSNNLMSTNASSGMSVSGLVKLIHYNSKEKDKERDREEEESKGEDESQNLYKEEGYSGETFLDSR